MIRNAFIAMGIAALVGCSGPSEPSVSEEFGPGEKTEAVSEVLNRIEVGGATIEFTRVEGAAEPAFLLIEKAPVELRWGAVDRVMAVKEELTLLEQFYALAPADATPHPALVEFHELQTAALGRADTAIHHPELGPDPVLEKTTIADCAFTVFPSSEDPWFDKFQRGPASSSAICTTSAVLCDRFTTQDMVVGTCALGADGGEFGSTHWGYGFRSEGERDFTHVDGGSLSSNLKTRVYWEGSFSAGADRSRMLSIDNTVSSGSLTVSVHSATRIGPVVP
jgi:hypothetical protein